MSFPPEYFTPLAYGIAETGLPSPHSVSYSKEASRRFIANPIAVTTSGVLALLLLFAVLGPVLSRHTYYTLHLPMKNQPPSSIFLLGTDELGRDMFTRLAYGARISLGIGIAAGVLDLIVGVAIGASAAAIGGKFDAIIMRIADILYSIPHLLIAIMLMVVLGSGIPTILIALTMTGWISMARIVRAQILQLRELDFVRAARAYGASHARILLRHLIPNTIGPIIATMTLTIPTAIFSEAFLSFLGIGVQPPLASWGAMVSDGMTAMRYYPWRLFLPAGCISITILCLHTIADGIRDAWDPRLR